MNEINQNQNLNNEIKPIKEEKDNIIRTVLYIALVIIAFIIILLLLKGCNSMKNKAKNQIIKTSEVAANMWNKCVDPIYWYTVEGTGVNGISIDINDVLNKCDTYYEETKNLKIDFESINDNEFKHLYEQVKKQNEIVYPKIKNATLESKKRVEFEEDMDLFYEYQIKLYELVKSKYEG